MLLIVWNGNVSLEFAQYQTTGHYYCYLYSYVVLLTVPKSEKMKCRKWSDLGALQSKKFQKSELTMGVGGWVQVPLGFC